MVEEIWKDIEGYECKYQVSNLGRIKSLNYNREKQIKILKPHIDCGGYLRVGLRKEGKEKIYKMHRLVAQAFLPNPNNYPQINHKDEDKTNNCVSNLEWCTPKYNSNYGTRNERLKGKLIVNNYKSMLGKFGKDNPNSKPINQYDLEGNFIREWDSTMDVKRELGYCQSSINSCVNGKLKTSYGYIWKYKEVA